MADEDFGHEREVIGDRLLFAVDNLMEAPEGTDTGEMIIEFVESLHEFVGEFISHSPFFPENLRDFKIQSKIIRKPPKK